MVAYKTEELRCFFNLPDFSTENFPQNLSAVSPFAQAIDVLWHFDKGLEKVDACYKRISECFNSTQRNSDFESAQFKDVQSQFLNKVKKRLEFKASHPEEENEESICQVFFESLSLVNLALSPKTQTTILEGHLCHFISLTTNCVDMARNVDHAKIQLEKNLKEFVLFCKQYKEKAINQGNDSHEVSHKAKRVVKKALQHVQNVLNEIHQLTQDPLCVGREPLYRARQALVLEKFYTPELEKVFNYFLSKNCYEDDQEILKLKFQFFCAFYEVTKSWFDWKAFLHTEFSGRLEKDWIHALPHTEEFKEWTSIPEVQAKLKEIQPLSLYKQAEAECRKKVSEQCYQRVCDQLVLSSCSTPFQVERVLKNLSDEAIEALENESIASCALMPVGIVTASPVLEVASIIEARIPLIKRLRALQFEDQDIKSVLTICAGYFLQDGGFEPHTYLLAMPTEQLKSFVHALLMFSDEDERWLALQPKPKQKSDTVSTLKNPVKPRKLTNKH